MLFQRRKPESESQQALNDASENLQRVEERAAEVSDVAAKLKLMRERNHFAERLQLIMEGHK